MDNKKVFLHVRISGDDKKILKMLAEAHNMRLSEYVRYLLHQVPEFEEASKVLVNNKLAINIMAGEARGI